MFKRFFFSTMLVLGLLLVFAGSHTAASGSTSGYSCSTNLQADSLFKVSDIGTPIKGFQAATMTFANGATSGTVSMPGIDSTWRVTADSNTAYTNAVYKKYVKPEKDGVDVVFSGDPGTTLTIAVVAVKF